MRITRLPVVVFLCAAALAGPASAAGPVPAHGSESLCSPDVYGASDTGYWVDIENRKMLLFRVSWSDSGEGCYAWLNRQPFWGINRAGSVSAKWEMQEGRMVFDLGKILIFLDRDSNEASLHRKESDYILRGSLRAP